MKTSSKLLFMIPVVGFLFAANANAARPLQMTAASPLIESLRSAHKLLVEADHDYKGHRAMAAHHLHLALKEMGAEPKESGKKTTGAGPAHEREPQSVSDAKLRQALSILQGLSTTGNPKVATHVNDAVKEINTALGIR